VDLKKILVVDDEKAIVEIVEGYLKNEGYSVIAAYDGSSALQQVQKHDPDLIILDLMLPEISGWDVCRTLRVKSDVPIIMLTARDEVTDRIVGLELGADDYVTKPFEPKELVSRVKAVLRRSGVKREKSNVVQIGDLVIDSGMRIAKIGNRTIELTPTEFELLRTMAENPNRVFSRMQLLDSVQGYSYEGYERTIDSHIKNLRKKIEPDHNHPRYIISVYGVGYKLESSENSHAS
jgi:two-component system OmpR family response regulator